MFNAGEISEKTRVLSLVKDNEAYRFNRGPIVMARVEYTDRVNIFSKVGIGAKTIKFHTRKPNITLFNALEWKDKHYFISDIKEHNRAYLEITTAQIEPRECKYIKNTTIKDELNRPKSSLETVLTFPGYLIEKYLGYQQLAPQAQNDMTFVLVTPKVIKLEVGDLIKIGEKTYNVRIVHDLVEYKNEYEINIVKEA